MHRFVALASILAVLLLGLVMTRGEPITAQEATSDAMATHPIVGTWRFVKDFGEGPTVPCGIFHADGTYIHEANLVMKWLTPVGSIAGRIAVDISAPTR